MNNNMQKKRIAEIVFKSNKLSTEQKIKIINSLNEGVLKTYGIMTVLYLLSSLKFSTIAALWAAYRAIRAAFSERSRRCGIFAIGHDRDYCLLLAKLEKRIKTLMVLLKAKQYCNKHKDPKKCIETSNKAAANYIQKIGSLQDKINKFKQRRSKWLDTKDAIEKGELRARDHHTKWF